jgi:hypothetical protein
VDGDFVILDSAEFGPVALSKTNPMGHLSPVVVIAKPADPQ